MTSEQQLELTVVDQRAELGEHKGPWSKVGDRTIAVTRSVGEIGEALRLEISKLHEVLGEATVDATGPYRCSEVEVALEFTLQGGFRLIGSAQAGVGTTITLHFKLHEDQA